MITWAKHPVTVWTYEILTPILSHIWNLSLSVHIWPMSWKRSNISIQYPRMAFPKKSLTTVAYNYITPVIARAFENAVYNTFVK